MVNQDCIKSFVAGADIPANRAVKFGVDDNTVILAAAATDSIIGISDIGGLNGQRLDIILADVGEISYGGTVTRGDLLTANATGQAITRTVAGSRVIGFAVVSGVIGDIGSVFISPSQY